MKNQNEDRQDQKAVFCHTCTLNCMGPAWYNFVESHNKAKSYAHFDLPVSLDMPSIQKYVLDKNKISQHSFYPFIHFQQSNSRYGKKSAKKYGNYIIVLTWIDVSISDMRFY